MGTAIVIGGGAAGLIACGGLAKRHEKVILIDHNNILAKKVRITGKGRCNVTNDADIWDFFKNIPTNPKFLYSALYSFTNDNIREILNDYGVKTKVERGGRIFPVSDNANDVADALKKYALRDNVEWIKTSAKELIIDNGRAMGVRTSKGIIKGDCVILASGGKSYPGTGSDGSGYGIAKKAGHTIVPLKPSLIPIEIEEPWVKELMGLALKNVELSVYNSKKRKIFCDFGEMLFTHFGISGPIVLSSSAHMKNIEKEKYIINIDLKPVLDMDKLDKRLLKDFEKYANKHVRNSLDDLLPKALIPVVIELSKIDPDKVVNSVTKEERRRLAELLKALPMTVRKFRPISEAIITSGGVSTKEIDPSTMESKIVNGLYFAGEIIDVDAYTGGYNLQIAFSTGYLAGENA